MGWWSKAFSYFRDLYQAQNVYTFHVSGRGKRIQTCLCVCPNNMLEYMARAWVRK